MSVLPTRSAPWSVLIALAVIATLPSCAADGDSTVDCVAELRLDGRSYSAYGELRRDPPTTDRRATAVIPSCGDSDTGDPGPDARVTASEVVGIPMGDAVLADDDLWIRDGLDVPAAAKVWFTAPACATGGVFDLTADWIGVLGEDGQTAGRDLPPPYVLDVHVTEGPAAYVGATIEVHADDTTSPELDHDDVETSLWEGGQVVARVSCDDGRFDALSLRVP